MKNTIFLTLFIALTSALSAQVAIGKQSVEGTTTLLDFDNAASNYRGIILPAVTNTNNALAGTPALNHGTFLLDRSDDIVKMYENGTWVFLSDPGTEPAATNNSAETGTGAIIGDDESSAVGVLILESPNSAMVLPRIANPHTTVKSPYPGMICYDTFSKSLAVFDGTVWNYWK